MAMQVVHVLDVLAAALGCLISVDTGITRGPACDGDSSVRNHPNFDMMMSQGIQLHGESLNR